MTKPVAWLNLVRKFKRLGFQGPFWGGHHPFMVKGSLRLIIPADHGKDIGDPLLKNILRQAGVSKKDWENLK